MRHTLAQPEPDMPINMPKTGSLLVHAQQHSPMAALHLLLTRRTFPSQGFGLLNSNPVPQHIPLLTSTLMLQQLVIPVPVQNSPNDGIVSQDGDHSRSFFIHPSGCEPQGRAGEKRACPGLPYLLRMLSLSRKVTGLTDSGDGPID